MDMQKLLDAQIQNEQMYSRKVVAKKITEMVREYAETVDKVPFHPVGSMISGYYQWLDKDHGWESKNDRVAKLDPLKDINLVTELLCIIIPLKQPAPIQSIGAMLSHRDIWLERPTIELDAVKTCCELICELAMHTTLYEIQITDEENGIKVVSKVPLDVDTQKMLDATMFLPPMFTPPSKLLMVNDSPYVTLPYRIISDRNGQQPEVNLHALNLAQAVGFTVDVESYQYQHKLGDPDEPLTAIQEHERIRNHQAKCAQALSLAADIVELDDNEPVTIYFPWFYDSRGRTYPHGYHLTPNGDAFEKSNLLLAKTQYVKGDFGI